MVMHCDDEWGPLGIAAGYTSPDEAKQSAEASYPGISAKWIAAGSTFEEARVLWMADLKAESCLFCGRTPLEVTSMIGSKARICNYCIDEFHRALHTAVGNMRE